MLGCFNPNLGQIWTNPNAGLKMSFKTSTVNFLIAFLTQHLGLSIFEKMLGCFNPNLGQTWTNLAFGLHFFKFRF